jgi:hypothetical protein
MQLILVFGAGAVCAFSLLVWLDLRRYPICPRCNDNLASRRPKLLGSQAECRVHGQFAPQRFFREKPMKRHI